MSKKTSRVALFVGFFGGGGVERITANLAHGFVRSGVAVDLLHQEAGSPHLWRLPSETRIIPLKASTIYKTFPEIVSYLRQERPSAFLSASHYMNEISLLANRVSGAHTRLVVAEHNQLSKTTRHATKLKDRLTPLSSRLLYPLADAIVAVSQGVAKDLSQTSHLPQDKIQTIYNPVITDEILSNAKESVEHSWFNSNECPVILGVGKLEAQKDFPNLIRAFAKVRAVQKARLVILGWGPDRSQLEALVKELKLEDDVDLPGYVQNPYAYMSKASVFVLSSAWEGLPTVLIEAMALGTPVISTDCESGPSEILAGGEYGHLVPVSNDQALTDAILQVLSGHSKEVDPGWLDQFSQDTATQNYLKILGIQA
jgi:glycosyltransferase involved in cell wall biosynthesis